MTENKKLLLVIGALASFIVLPYLGGYIYFDGKFPDDFFAFPPLTAPEKAPFNMLIFVICWIFFFGFAAIYHLPGLLDSRKHRQPPRPRYARQDYPSGSGSAW